MLEKKTKHKNKLVFGHHYGFIFQNSSSEKNKKKPSGNKPLLGIDSKLMLPFIT